MHLLMAPLETAAQFSKPSARFLRLPLRVRIFDPRFLGAKVQAVSNAQLAPQLRVTLFVKGVDQFFQCGPRRVSRGCHHARCLISQDGSNASLGLFKLDRAAETPLKCVEAGESVLVHVFA
jgi:hypothetical protein